MKKIAICAAAFALILVLTKIANQSPADPLPGAAFGLKGQQVVQCSADKITLVDNHQKATRLEKDQSWPDCSVFPQGQRLDFYLSQGEKTRFLNYEPSPWWRQAL